MKKRLFIFASGTPLGGGSGFRNLVHATRLGVLRADIVGVASQHAGGGVQRAAAELGVPFTHFTQTTPEAYWELMTAARAEWASLSGWLRTARGLDPKRTINIHPGPLPEFGGKGMYGNRIHAAVLEAYRREEIPTTAVTMHFVTERYDEGPAFFDFPVMIEPNDDVASLSRRVQAAEHAWQPWVTDLVLHGDICWDGDDPASLVTPDWWPWLPL